MPWEEARAAAVLEINTRREKVVPRTHDLGPGGLRTWAETSKERGLPSSMKLLKGAGGGTHASQ